MANSRKNDIVTMLKEAGALLVITLVAGLLLGFVYQLTKNPIAKQEELAIQNACAKVIPEANHFELLSYTVSDELAVSLSDMGVTIGTVYEAQDAAGGFLGYVLESTSSEGYGGNIVLYLGIIPTTDPMTIEGVSILSISETPGLGMRAEEVLVPQLTNKQAYLITYTKTGATASSEIDAISGATITTKAVTNAVNGGLKAAEEFLEFSKAEGRVGNGE